jgi:hypothetical protein
MDTQTTIVLGYIKNHKQELYELISNETDPYYVGDIIKQWIIESNPFNTAIKELLRREHMEDQYNLYNDLIIFALSEIDWYDITTKLD